MKHHKAIEIKNLSYAYPDNTEALQEINLEVEEGESIAIVGPNGAGKSTLLLHLNGILENLSASGEIKIFGLPTTRENLREIRRRVGVVFQDPDDQLFSPTVFEDVAFGPLNMELSPDEIRERVKKALSAVEMLGFEDKMAHHLSFGQKKRVAIASVLSMEPDILALDEPWSSLDARGRRKLLDILKNLPLTKLVVTHDLVSTVELCERMVVMDKGKIVADGPLLEILSDKKLLEEHGLELPTLTFEAFQNREYLI